MYTLVLIYLLAAAGNEMHTVQVPGFQSKEACERGMFNIVSDIENISEVRPMGWWLISGHCLPLK
jgi:hypothetical protein